MAVTGGLHKRSLGTKGGAGERSGWKITKRNENVEHLYGGWGDNFCYLSRNLDV